jgi:hypothetical protein
MMMTKNDSTNYWLIKIQNPATGVEGFLKLGIRDIWTDATTETATRFESFEEAWEIAGYFSDDLLPESFKEAWEIVEITG